MLPAVVGAQHISGGSPELPRWRRAVKIDLEALILLSDYVDVSVEVQCICQWWCIAQLSLADG